MEIVALVTAALLGSGAIAVGTMASLETRDLVEFLFVRRARSIADAKGRVGRARVRGAVEPVRGVVSAPLTGLECVYYRTHVWRLLASEGSVHYESKGELRGGAPFVLSDATAIVFCPIPHDVEADFTVDTGPLRAVPRAIEEVLEQRGSDMSWARGGDIHVTEALILPGEAIDVIVRTTRYRGKTTTTVEHMGAWQPVFEPRIVRRAAGLCGLTVTLTVAVVALVQWALP